MRYFVLAAFVLAVAAALPFDIVEDEEGVRYYALPISREKRQTNWGISSSGFGAGHKGTILNTPTHRLDGSGYASKNWNSHGLRPDTLGGRLDYAHKPSRSGAFVGADNVRGYGTDLSAGVKYNVYQNKNLGVDVSGQYQQHFGGPGGTGRGQPGAFLNVKGTF